MLLPFNTPITSSTTRLDSGGGTLLVFSRILQTLIFNNTVHEIIILQARAQLGVSVKNNDNYNTSYCTDCLTIKEIM